MTQNLISYSQILEIVGDIARVRVPPGGSAAAGAPRRSRADRQSR